MQVDRLITLFYELHYVRDVYDLCCSIISFFVCQLLLHSEGHNILFLFSDVVASVE